MKRANRLILIFTLVCSATSIANELSNSNNQNQAEDWLSQNLLKRQQYLREANTIDELLAMEQKELSKLTKLASPEASDAITLKQANKLLKSISPHPIVGDIAYDYYNRAGREIGFCFGRATYVHLALLRMGVKKDAIKKIWTVGQTGGEVNWIYHVATAVRTTDGNWTVIDNFVNRLVTAQEWATMMRTMTVDGKKATFITDAKKFGPKTGAYSRVQLGLELSRDKDFYQNYFVDLFKWFGEIDSHKWFDKFGLRKVTGEKVKVPPRLLRTEIPKTSITSKITGAVCRPLRFADVFIRNGQAFSVTGKS